MELTDRKIRGLKEESRKEIPDKSYRDNKPRKGLVLLASPTGNHTWLYQRMVKGTRIKKVLGAYPDLSLARARELVDDINDRDAGPAEAIQEMFIPEEPEGDILTVQKLINRYMDEECSMNRDWKNQQLVLERELSPYLTLPADQLEYDHVAEVVQGCLDRGSPRTAKEALKQIKGMYNWAMGQKRLKKRTVAKQAVKKIIRRLAILDLPVNPAVGIELPKYEPRNHHLEGKALTKFLDRLRASTLRDDCKQILEIQMQTFCRVGEVSGMRWDELNLKIREWVIPGERYKNGQDHTVHLSKQTAKQLRQIKKGNTSDYVFPMPRRDKPMTAQDVAKEINKVRTKSRRKKSGEVAIHKGRSLRVDADFSSHSLRHSGATWLSSQPQCSSDVRERLVGHKMDAESDMGARYNHHDYAGERREWTQKWCDFLEGK